MQSSCWAPLQTQHELACGVQLRAETLRGMCRRHDMLVVMLY